MIRLALFLLLVITPQHVIDSQEDCDKIILLGVEAMNNKDHVKSLELLTQVKTVAEEHQWYQQLFLAVNNIGVNYYSMLDYGEALNNYLSAYTIAIKHLSEDQEMIVLNNIAVLYLKDRQFAKAEEYVRKAYQIAKSTNTKSRIGMYAINVGIVANEQGNAREARKYIDEAIELVKDNPELLEHADMALAENHLLSKNYKEAAGIAQHIINEGTYSWNKIPAFIILSKVDEADGHLDKAIYHCRMALTANPTTEDKITIYERLSYLYQKTNLLHQALVSKDSVLKSSAQLNDIRNGRLFETNRVKFEIQNYQKESQKNLEKIKSERRTFYIIISVALLIILIITWALRSSSTKNKQKKEILRLELEKRNSDNLLLEKQLREKETIALLEEERLKNEIEIRNRKLAVKALNLSHRNEVIEDIIESLGKLPEISGNTKLMAHLQELKGQLKSDAELKDFFTHFEEVNSGILTILKQKHPVLNSNDIRFLSYIYINLSTKEISSLLNITPEACRKRKERILRKLELPDDTELFDYISGFVN
ncbi:MAG TPA: tetratricopeptide repeat protein [Lentimicrobium sp.]|nr:tetratricopeptide repeat protein [Lentimicrobium sp.]